MQRPRRPEALESDKKPIQAKAVAAALGSVLKAGGASCFDSFVDLAERFGADIHGNGVACTIWPRSLHGRGLCCGMSLQGYRWQSRGSVLDLFGKRGSLGKGLETPNPSASWCNPPLWMGKSQCLNNFPMCCPSC